MDSSGAHGNHKSKGNQNIQVYLRVRPLSIREQSLRTIEIVDVPSARDIQIRQSYDAKITKKFTFDRVFGADSKQKDVYSNVVAPFIGEVLSGYNCTVFAYGQTGTGKTFTMVGDDSTELRTSWEDDCPMGIIPRAVVHLFDELRMMDVEFSMRISYLELYNEELCDLLGTDDSLKIRIYDDSSKKGSVIVQGLEEIPVHSKDDVYKLLAKGQERRKTAATLMNAQSSRSHTVFSILVHIKENGIDGEDMLKIGKLNLVDLAGSENITKAGNEKGIRTREAVNINQSLLTLGRVITALVERQPHVPYRESKLTRLLQESLGGRTKTSIIATISPGSRDMEETLNTLDYAHRAKNIQNRPEINQRLTKKTVLKDYTEEIDRLKRDLNAAREKNGIYLPDDEYNDIMMKMECQTKELNEKIHMIRAIKGEMEKKEKMFDEVQRHLDQKTRELRATSENLNRTNLILRDTKETLRVVEQRYEESSHLVQVHQKTENILAGQARELVGVADEASAHTYGLHDAIQRRRNVDEVIRETVRTFGDDLHAEMDMMKERIVTYFSDMCSQSVAIEEELVKNRMRSRDNAEELRKKIEEMEKSNNASSEESQEIFNAFRGNLLRASDENLACLVGLLEKAEQKQKKHHEERKMQFDEMRSIEERSRRIAADFFGKLQAFPRKMRENTDAFVANHREFFAQAKQYNDVTLHERNEAMKKEVEENQRTLTEVYKTMKVIEERNRALLTHLTHNANDGKAFAEKLSANNHQVSDYHENILNVLSTVDADRCGAEQRANDISKERMEVVGIVVGQNDKSIAILQGDVKAIVREIETKKSHGEKNIEEVSGKLDANHLKAKQQLHRDTSHIIEKVKLEEEDAAESHKSVQMEMSKARENSFDFKESTCETIQKMHDNITELYTTNLKTYTSTGETPIRKEFTYNRVLAATSPHERILNRFRANLRAAAESSARDDQENIVEEDTGAPLVMSTPISTAASVLPPNDDRCLRELNFDKAPSLGKKKDDQTNLAPDVSAEKI
ncbi:kinesin-like protein Klp61F [Lutzomyia longipalpis]|uniref:kinesin-like protein Klp61F n=1 Tax=Lutzomyia longipalpis TaxID=7200 RepID=UPI002483F74A|nr:kinesin-like protein Klp61F [Lutzomyia longipalpis]